MTKLEELILKYCPNGVEYREIKEITSAINIGINPRKFFKLNPEDATGFYVTVRELNGLMGVKQHPKTDTINEEAISFIASRAKIEKGDILFSNTGTVGKMALVVDEATNWGVNEGIFIIKPINEVIDSKFLYYYLSSKNAYNQYSKRFTGSTLKHITQEALSSLRTPVPPLEVQREIVHVLDSFTFLSAELSAELQARKKQYEFYREELIKPKSCITKYKLKEICDIYLGLTATPKYTESGVKFISAQNTSKDYLDLENVKYISEDEYERATSNAKPQKGDLLFTRVGSNLGHPVIVETDEKLCIFVSLGFLRIKNKNQVSIRYLKHWMNTELFWSQVRKNVHGAAKVNLNTGWLEEFDIALPSIETQNKINDVLDNFESICNDLNIGLPAEIEARQKQYEYYRDMLLTFAETGDIMPQTDRQTSNN